MRVPTFLLWIVLLLPAAACAQEAPRVTLRDGGVERVEDGAFRVTHVVEGMSVPWGMDFLPDGLALVSDRGRGTLAVLDLDAGSYRPLEGLPPIVTERDAGIRDVRVHPDHATNGWIYLSYSTPAGSGSTLAVDRARLAGDRHGPRLQPPGRRRDQPDRPGRKLRLARDHLGHRVQR